MYYTIKNEELCVVISQRGAEVQSIKSNEDIEYLWQGDKQYWIDRAPVLFPYIGRMTEGCYYLDGKLQRMEKHGFARHMDFDPEIIERDRIVFSLSDNSVTYEQYPRQFKFLITYKLEGRRLTIRYEVKNTDEKDMYFAIGGHPGFNVPLEKSCSTKDYYIHFSQCEPERVLLSPTLYCTGETEKFHFDDNGNIYLKDNYKDGESIILKDAGHTVSIQSDKSKHRVTVNYPDMQYITIWHRYCGEKMFICLEPWTSLPSRADIIETFENQVNLIKLKSSKDYCNEWNIEIE